MTPWRCLTATCVPFPDDHVDTDQIIPARFLVTTAKDGLGPALFADRRGSIPLDAPERAGAQILVAGDNFGCGSSREHAPWALLAWGFRAVIAPSFADIFRTNALKCGLLPVSMSLPPHAALLEAVTADPTAVVTIDLTQKTTQLPSGEIQAISIDSFARDRLLSGEDELDYLLARHGEITTFEETHG